MEKDVKYQAPLLYCDLEDVVPDEYIVYLAKDVTLGQHRNTVGEALQDSKISVIFDNLFPDKICYSADLDAESLRIIRGDEGVEFVECNGFAHADAMEEL